MTMNIELLRELCLLFGPSGCEDDVREFIKKKVADFCDELYVDRLGNLIARIKGNCSNKIMISAHMDEVGFMVNEITDSGYLKFGTLGGIDTRVLCGKNVTIEANDGKKIKGLITSKAIHHKKRSERLDIVPITSMYIDIGVRRKRRSMWISALTVLLTLSSSLSERTAQRSNPKRLTTVSDAR